MTRARSLSQLANSNVFTVSTNNRIGIGSDAPTTKLDVDGALNVSGNAAFGGVVTYEDVTNIDSVGIITARDDIHVTGGSVGIGTDNPTVKLDVDNVGSGTTIRINADTSNSASLILAESKATKWEFESVNANDNRFRLVNQTGDESLSVLQTGNIGIGSIIPAAKLDVDGALNVSGNATFGGNVQVGGDPVSGNERGVHLNAGGTIFINQNTGSPILRGYRDDTNAISVNIDADGSASFAGGVDTSSSSNQGMTIGGSGNITVQRDAGTKALFQGYNSTGNTIKFLAEGSALFASNKAWITSTASLHLGTGDVTTSSNRSITLRGDTGAATFASEKFSIATTGNPTVTRTTTNAANPLLTLQSNIGNTPGDLTGVTYAEIFANGSATFGSTSSTTGTVFKVNGSGTGDGSYNIASYSGGGTTFSVSRNGSVGIGGLGSNAPAYIASDGSATFGNEVIVSNSGTIGQTRIGHHGAVYIDRVTNNTDKCFTIDANNVEKVSILANGTATFAGQVDVGNPDSSSSSSEGIELYKEGLVASYVSADSNSAIVVKRGNTVNMRVKGDGSALFNGKVDIDGSYLNVQRTSSSQTILQGGYTGNASKVLILADGTANFDGIVTSGNFNATSNSTTGVQCGSGGAINVQRLSTSGASSVFRGYQGATINTEIRADGSAEFAGHVTAERYSSTSTTSADSTGTTLSLIAASGGVVTGRLKYFNTGNFALNNSTSNLTEASANTLLKADGSAEFAGSGQWFDFDTTDATNGYGALISASSSGSTLRTVLQLQAKGGASASGAALGIRRGTTQNILLEYGGAATFAGNVTVGNGVNTSSTTNSGSVYYSGGSIYTQTAASATATNTRFRLYHGTSLNVSILNNGSATFAGTVTENASDRKFKENIADAPSQLADVAALQLRTWDWNELAPGSEERNARHRMGLVAQEAELVDPNLAYEVVEGEDRYKAIDYKVLTMKLLGAVAELKAEVEALKNA